MKKKSRYTEKWKRYSRLKRHNEVWCEVNHAMGKLVEANVVDHIIPIEGGGSFWDPRNHMIMTDYFHNLKRKMESTGLQLESIKTHRGLIPKDRSEIIEIFKSKFIEAGTATNPMKGVG